MDDILTKNASVKFEVQHYRMDFDRDNPPKGNFNYRYDMEYIQLFKKLEPREWEYFAHYGCPIARSFLRAVKAIRERELFEDSDFLGVLHANRSSGLSRDFQPDLQRRVFDMYVPRKFLFANIDLGREEVLCINAYNRKIDRLIDRLSALESTGSSSHSSSRSSSHSSSRSSSRSSSLLAPPPLPTMPSPFSTTSSVQNPLLLPQCSPSLRSQILANLMPRQLVYDRVLLLRGLEPVTAGIVASRMIQL